MMVLGTDTHKRSHTIAAVSAATGELIGEQTVGVGAKGFAALVVWARELGTGRVWAIEDCRHVSGSFERFLIARGERILRGNDEADGRLAAPRSRARESPTASTRSRSRARRCARGWMPCQRRNSRAPNSTCGCSSTTASAWFVGASRSTTRCNGICTTSARAALAGQFAVLRHLGAARRPAGAEQTMRVRIARDELRHIRELSQAIKALEAEIAQLVAQIAPQLLTEPGFGPLTATKLVGEVAGIGRFASDAKLARAAGVAPIFASSGKTNRHRLDRDGNRQINATIHRIAVTRLRCHPETQDYIARKRAEGKNTKEAIRCLKRHLACRIWHLLQTTGPAPSQAITTSIA